MVALIWFLGFHLLVRLKFYWTIKYMHYKLISWIVTFKKWFLSLFLLYRRIGFDMCAYMSKKFILGDILIISPLYNIKKLDTFQPITYVASSCNLLSMCCFTMLLNKHIASFIVLLNKHVAIFQFWLSLIKFFNLISVISYY